MSPADPGHNRSLVPVHEATTRGGFLDETVKTEMDLYCNRYLCVAILKSRRIAG